MILRRLLPFALLALTACRVHPAPHAPAPAPAPASTAPDAPPLQFEELVQNGPGRDAPLPLIIAIHGLGDQPGHFLQLFGDFPLPARIVAPRGPLPHGDGASWFPVNRLPPDPNDRDMLAGIWASTDKLAALTRWLVAHRRVRGKPIVMGFSQGGILSEALAARHGELFAAAIPVSGGLPAALFPKRVPALPVYALHGTADPTVPLAWDQAGVAALRAAGADAALIPFDGVGHTITRDMLRVIYDRLQQLMR